MRKIFAHVIGVDQGDLVLFNDYVNDGDMWAGSGEREYRREVKFSEEFSEEPVVNVWLSLWDFSNSANARADVRAEDIKTDRFTIVFNTWSDTQIARVRVAWQAIGPATSDEEMWDV